MIKFWRKYDVPWITALFTTVCVIVFFGINLNSNPYAWSTLMKWGAFPPIEIWNGQIFALITSAFVHIEIWHIGFNLLWFWKFGRKIEFESSNSNDQNAKENLNIINKNKLSKEAFEAYEVGNIKKAQELFKQILEIDPTNEWAKIFIDQFSK